MSNVKTPKILILMLALALAGAMLVAGCGGSGGTTTTAQGAAAGKEPNAAAETEEAPPEEAPAEEPAEEAEEEAPAEEEPAEEESSEPSEAESRSGESSLAAEGKEVFTTNCGTCHTLKAAGTTGTVGPNLDELEPELATVEHQVVNGGGPMPAFGNDGILNAKEIKAVATYVSSVAGQG